MRGPIRVPRRRWLAVAPVIAAAGLAASPATGVLGSSAAREPAAKQSTAPPNTVILRRPAKRTTKRIATFSFFGGEGAVFGCSLDGSRYVLCSAPKTYRGLSVGRHTFGVTASDTSGNVDMTPAKYTWTIIPRPHH